MTTAERPAGGQPLHTRQEGSSALGVDSHSLEQRDCLIGIFGPAEKNRVLQVAEVRAASRMNTGLLKPLEQCVEVSGRMIFEGK